MGLMQKYAHVTTASLAVPTDLNVHAADFTPPEVSLTLAQHLELAASLEHRASKQSVLDSDSDHASESGASAASTVGTLNCRFCRQPGHEIKVCPQLVCRYCAEQGHRQSNCRAFDEDREWVKWARRQPKLSGGQLKFLEQWD